MSEREDLQVHRRKFLDAFPSAVNAETGLRSANNQHPFFFWSKCDDQDLIGCWWVLGRLGTELEKQFGISSEVLFLFSPHNDLQRRTYNALTDRLRDEVSQRQIALFESVRFTPDRAVAFLATPDPSASEKLEVWNLEGNASLVASMPPLEKPASEQRQLISRAIQVVLASRDLYRGRNPVTGNDFFGRQDILLTLKTELTSGRSVGLFGFRRAGKTSVIREFQRRSKASNIVVVLSDLEAVGSLDEIPVQMSSDLTNALRELRDVDPSVWLGPESEHKVDSHPGLSARLIRVAEKNRRMRFVIALDEVESLVPLVNRDPESVRLFLGALRRAAQKTDNLVLLITGVTTRFFDQSSITENVENPMFGFVEELFLRPFAQVESMGLVRKLGRGMGLNWDEDALQLLHVAAGGFPFFVRSLASAVRAIAIEHLQSIEVDEPVVVSIELVRRAIPAWNETASMLWGEIVRTLEIHLPLMAEMVKCASNSELSAWLDVGAEAQAAARSLESLGMLVRSDSGWERSASLLSLQALGSPPVVDVKHIQVTQQKKTSDAARIRSLLSLIESQDLEFKSSAKYNLITKKADKAIETSVVKTVAGFMNASGGTLLIGVSDEGAVVGLENDLSLTRNSIDKYQLSLCDMLVTNLGQQAVTSFVAVECLEIDGQTICEIRVGSTREPVWCSVDGNDVLFVRSGPQTRKMPNREILSYSRTRFPDLR